MKLFWTIALVLLAAACTPMQWARPDADASQLDADTRDCQVQAWNEARWRSYQYAGMYGPFLYRDSLGRPFAAWPQGPFGDPFGERFMEESRLANFCMRTKGYELQPTK
ncbi:MAG TPA: hypothetical protein VM183_16980 [Burkholderiales bacterium]|nr:hypothetical protein [Burkholderiales bacterium]